RTVTKKLAEIAYVKPVGIDSCLNGYGQLIDVVHHFVEIGQSEYPARIASHYLQFISICFRHTNRNYRDACRMCQIGCRTNNVLIVRLSIEYFKEKGNKLYYSEVVKRSRYGRTTQRCSIDVTYFANFGHQLVAVLYRIQGDFLSW
uniref:Uncharacterized protein n=1 Tax=Romanomermis culicivorax TaxID=13658 RepID=A0A915IXN8_ROMCU